MIRNKVTTGTAVPRKELKEFQGDFKLPNPKEIRMLADRIAKHGFVAPVFTWKGNGNLILDGHQRVKALNLLATDGETLEGDLVPVVEIEAESETEARQRVAEYNSKYSEIDAAFAQEWLEGVDIDGLPMIGFEMPDEEAEDKEQKEDVVPVLKTAEFAVRGDLFRLGRHYLMCGDSLDQDDYAKLMASQNADLVFTDPPYNVGYKGIGKNTSRTIENDDMGDEEFDEFLLNAFKMMEKHAKDGAPFYVFHAASTAKQFQRSMEANRLEIVESLVWNKPSAGLGMNDYRRKHEPFFYARKAGQKIQFYGDRTNTSVWDFGKSDEQILKMIKAARAAESEGKTTIWTMKREPVAEYVHPTQKPVELIGYALANSSKSGDVVLDPFGGSGATLIACEKFGRVCHTMELDPVFAETIVLRFADYDGSWSRIECLTRPDEFDLWKLSRNS